MTVRDINTLKSYFETGDIPTQVQFSDVFDTMFALSENQETDLSRFNTVGDGVVDDTTAFLAALADAESSGRRLITNSDPTKRFLLKRVPIINDITIDLGGGTLVADFKGVLMPNNCTNILTAPGGFAKNTLIFSDVGTLNDTIIIGSKTYTLRTTVSTTAHHVLIGASPTDTAFNLVAAINGETGGGTLFGSLSSPNLEVRAAAVGGVVTLTALEEGTGGNAITTVENSTSATFTNPTLTGGLAPIRIVLRNLTIDGQNDGTATSGGGEPLLLFRGGREIVFDNVQMTNGGNRNSTTWPRLLEFENCEVLIDDPLQVKLIDCEFRSSTGEMVNIQSWSARTVAQVERCFFTKKRDYNPALLYSSSGLNMFNLNGTSYVRGVTFRGFIKSAANFITPGSFENIFVDGVRDSVGLDFSEARNWGVDNIVIRNITGRNILDVGADGHYLIRASANNLIIENVVAQNCLAAVVIEGDTSGELYSDAWMIDEARELENIFLRNIRSVAGDASSEDSIVHIKGASSSLPAHVVIEGGPNKYAPANATISPVTYGIRCEHTDLTLRGGRFADGRNYLVHMTGYANFRADGVRFNAEGAALATHVVLFDAATIQNIVFTDCEREGILYGGASDIRFLNAPTLSGRIFLDRSPTITVISDASKPVLRDGFLRGTAAYNPASLADGEGAQTTITVTGAALGDLAAAAFDISTAGVMLTAFVSAPNTVTARFQNETGGVLDLAAGNLSAWVNPRVGS